MDLHRALRQRQASPGTEAVSPLQALRQLNETVTEALLACLKEQPEQASQFLLSALPQLYLAMSSLGLDPQQPRASHDPIDKKGRRVIFIDGNRVEVRVNDETRGSWSIWSVADLKEVCRLAEEFDCDLVYSFIGNWSSSPPPPSPASL